MVLYVCNNGCGYTTEHKTRMTKHTSRKTPCKKKTNDNTSENILVLLNSINDKLDKLIGREKTKIRQEQKKPSVVLTDYKNPNAPNKLYEDAARHDLFFIPYAIEYIHFNPELPENHNIIATNSRNGMAKVFDGKIWKTVELDNLIKELISTYELIFGELNGIDSQKYNCITKYLDKLTPELEKEINTKIKRLIIDYSKNNGG